MAYQDKTSGNALVIILITIAILAGLGITFFMAKETINLNSQMTLKKIDCAYLAESGAAAALAELRSGFDADADGLGAVHGELGEGKYRVVVTDLGEGQYKLISTGSASDKEKQIEVIATENPGGIFWHAIFAGNSSGSPNYNLPFSGSGTHGDIIQGDVYSGKNLSRVDSASIRGQVMVFGLAAGVEFTKGSQPLPDLAAMDYEKNSQVRVAEVFATKETYANNDAGGSAWEVPQKEPAHIFRKNPTDRSRQTGRTEKDDYFLENSYGSIATAKLNESQDPALDGNRKVYFVDGNLWLYNRHASKFEFQHSSSEGVQLAIIVKGNIYLAGNLGLRNSKKDGLLLLALRDSHVQDSGNIYIGEPECGTVEKIEAFLYAENNIVDQNWNSSGPAPFEISGSMGAGNHILLHRDDFLSRSHSWVRSKGVWSKEWVPGYWVHSALNVTLDPRVRIGQLNLPGMPLLRKGAGEWSILSWRSL